MNLDFASVTISKFKTFTGKPQTFALTGAAPGLRFVKGRNDFEPDLGSNGAAKSSVFSAMCWCLYGRTVNNLRNPDVIPWTEGGTPRVTVKVFTDDKPHSITRTASPNALLLDGAMASQDDIDALIGVGFEVFKHTVLLGQGQPLFFDLSPKGKMDVFAAALHLDRWDERSALAATQARAFEAELLTLRAGLIATDATIVSTKALLKTAESRVGEWEAERKTRAATLKAQLADLEGELVGLHKSHAVADLARDSAGTELQALEREIAHLREEWSKARTEHTKAETHLEAASDVLARTVEELNGLGGTAERCPTCGQSLLGTALADHRNELRARVADLKGKLKAGVGPRVASRLKNATSALANATAAVSAFNKKALAAQTTLNVVLPEVIRLESQIRHLKGLATDRDRELNPFTEQVAALRRQLTNLTSTAEDLAEDQRAAEKDLARTSVWIKGFKEVRLSLIEELLQELELATNALLPESGLRDWSVSYAIEKETKKGGAISGLTVTVLSPTNKHPVKWECWSGGEGNRLLVVGALALGEVLLNYAGVRTNLEILDEPTRGLSSEGVQDLCEFLASRAQTLEKDVFLVDQMALESTAFTEVITIVKGTDGKSYIE